MSHCYPTVVQSQNRVCQELDDVRVRLGLAVEVLLGGDAAFVDPGGEEPLLEVHHELAVADEVEVRRLAHLAQQARHRTAHTWVERFDRRGTEPFELFRSEFGQNSLKI